MAELPLDPKKEIWSWGPIPFRLYYGDWFRGIFQEFPKVYPGHHWPSEGLALSKDRRFVFVFELDALTEVGGKLFREELLPKDRREWTRGKWKEARDVLRAKEHEIAALELSELPFEDFTRVWQEFWECVSTFWLYSNLPELANYGSIEILKEKLAPLVPGEEIDSVLEILSAPLGLSFYQEEEIDLAETDDIKTHQQKYFWIKNSYAHVEVCPVSFFEERKRGLSSHVRKEMWERLEKAQREKEDVRARYHLTDQIMDIAETISDAMVWQDTRKGEIWIYLHTADVLLAEAARRVGRDKNDLLDLFSFEVLELLEGKEPAVGFAERKKLFGVRLSGDHFFAIGSEEAGRYWKAYVEHQDTEHVTELKGVIASKGKAIGKARIVLDAHESFEFDQGDILITTMTSPEYVFVMKKAGAVVTDTGGLTSHAAIVSRELNVPCIVGTKLATSAFKDGDMVEVDANLGVVRKV